MIKLVVFDLDDTLVDTGSFFIKSIREAASQVGLVPPTEDQVKALLGLPFNPLLERIWPGIDHEEIKQAYYDIELRSTCECFPGVKYLLERLEKEGYSLGILTSRTIKGVLRVLNNAGIDRADFLFIETPDKQKFHKPDPRVFDGLLNDAKIKGIYKEEIIYIGDTLHDMEAAKGAGLHYIALINGHTTKESFTAKGQSTELVAEDADQVLGIITQLGKELEISK